MTTPVTIGIDDTRATLTVSGRFDFSIHRDFRKNYEEILTTPGVRELDVNLSTVDYIDSSALGMLLLLREKAGTQHISVQLVGPNGSVQQVLEVANFGRLFEIR